METKVEDVIRKGVAALKAGRKQEAFELLTRATELDEHSEDAWLWLSAVVDSRENQQICLENVLAINPDNSRALRGLNKIQKQMDSRARPELDEDPFGLPQPPVSSPPAKKPATGPFDLNARPSQQTSADYHGSGQDVDLPSGSEYDAWVDNLNLGAAEDVFVGGVEEDAPFEYDDGAPSANKPFFDPFAVPAASELEYGERGDVFAEFDDLEPEDETLLDDEAFEGASPFGLFEADAPQDYQDEQSLRGYLNYLPPDIKPTHLPGQQPLYPRGLVAGLVIVSVGIVAALVVLVQFLV